MTNERFNELMGWLVIHPLFPFRINRLMMALRAVVEATGDAGDAALEAFARQREELDWSDEADETTDQLFDRR